MQRTYISALLIISVAGCSRNEQSAPVQQQAPSLGPKPAARQVDRCLFGTIVLGEPLNIPACKRTDETGACVVGVNEDGTTRVRIHELSKSYRYNWNIDVQEIDGTVEIATIESLDNFGDDREMLRDLIEKYGSPTSSGRYDDLTDWADWGLNGLSVYWQGSGADVRYGVAVIRTPKGQAFSDAQRKAHEASIPRL